MNPHSRTILQRSLEFIDNYRNGLISLKKLVNSLEGSLNALEEKLPKEFYESWFSFWGDLETVVALGNELQTHEDVNRDIESLEEIISKVLSE